MLAQESQQASVSRESSLKCSSGREQDSYGIPNYSVEPGTTLPESGLVEQLFELIYPPADLVASSTKALEGLSFVQGFQPGRWVVNRPVQSRFRTQVERTHFFRTQSDHDIELLVGQLVYMFGPLCGDIDANFLHDAHGHRVHRSRS